jgi:hypothetical protein
MPMHVIPSALPRENEEDRPKRCQIFFLDDKEATEFRQHFTDVDPVLMRDLEEVLLAVNPHMRVLNTFRETLRIQRQAGNVENVRALTLTVVQPNEDPSDRNNIRRYAERTSDEVFYNSFKLIFFCF